MSGQSGQVRILLRAKGLTKSYRGSRLGLTRTGAGRGTVHAVRDLSLQIQAGETLALVGESGCGKSTTGRLLLGLERPTKGRVEYRGRDISVLAPTELREFRRQAQIVFQDPFSSLNPRITVGGMFREILRFHGIADGRAAGVAIARLLELVGLGPGDTTRYPHEFSGGQRQRLAIARALSVGPEFIVADEPVSALDVSVQAQVLNLLTELQSRLTLTLLLVAHDLAVVRQVSDRVAVMYLGRIVEVGPTELVYREPLHPYTRVLLAAVPRLRRDPDSATRAPPRERVGLTGEVRAELTAPHGCPFYERCSHPARDAACVARLPDLEPRREGRGVRCVKA